MSDLDTNANNVILIRELTKQLAANNKLHLFVYPEIIDTGGVHIFCSKNLKDMSDLLADCCIYNKDFAMLFFMTVDKILFRQLSGKL
jgi:hypothetical protein